MKVITYKLQAVWGPICFLSETKFDDATFEKFWIMESQNLTNLVVSINNYDKKCVRLLLILSRERNT